MIKRALILFALALLSAPALAADGNYNHVAPQGQQFVKALDDVPLMPGLKPVNEDDMLFAARGRRIAEATAQGFVDVDEVYYFYERSLPELGWKKITPRLYTRSKDTLSIDADAIGEDAKTTVHYAIRPN